MPPAPSAPSAPLTPPAPPAPLGRRFFAYLAVLLLFTLGNSSDAFLLLRATELGVGAALLPVLWAMLHLVKSVSSTPGGILSDTRGRKPVIVAGWMVYALVYLMFGHATDAWQVWVRFACMASTSASPKASSAHWWRTSLPPRDGAPPSDGTTSPSDLARSRRQ